MAVQRSSAERPQVGVGAFTAEVANYFSVSTLLFVYRHDWGIQARHLGTIIRFRVGEIETRNVTDLFGADLRSHERGGPGALADPEPLRSVVGTVSATTLGS